MRWLPIREDFQDQSHQSRNPAVSCSKATEQIDLKETYEVFNDQKNQRDPVGDFGDCNVVSLNVLSWELN